MAKMLYRFDGSDTSILADFKIADLDFRDIREELSQPFQSFICRGINALFKRIFIRRDDNEPIDW